MPALSDAVAVPVAPSAAPAAPATPTALGLPSPFLDVLQGAIPAVSLPPLLPGQPPNSAQEWTIDNFKALVDAGLGYAELPDATSVFFNPKLTNEKQVLAAGESGKIGQLAPPVSQIGAPPTTQTASAVPAAAPREAPPAPPPPSIPPVGALAGVTAAPQAPGGANRQQSRLRNVAPPVPNKPGQGPLAQLQRRAV